MSEGRQDELRATCHALLDDLEFSDDDLAFIALLLTTSRGSRPASVFARLHKLARRSRTPRHRRASDELGVLLNSLFNASEANHG
ncbi:hypothetical protein AB3X91_03580 [Paraburkholderia sp. BR14263]|uniref:hypothetical protein n=1 Tax=unclassified Paraburkholderia TaxID=2615204 RepID=UPI0034CD4110